jgi:hypothetical protein
MTVCCVERDLLSQAVRNGTVTFEQACEVMEKANRHPGGRPKGSLNSGPDKLEQAIIDLEAKRSEMTAEEVAESEYRMDRMVSKRWNWKSYRVRREAIRAGALAEELNLLLAYKRSEDRVGMSRRHLAKGIHRASGPVFGYKTEPEAIVEEFKPIRWRQGGRRWLAPINDDGSNGMTLDNAGIVPEPTIGELHRAEVERDRVRGGRHYEPDYHQG